MVTYDDVKNAILQLRHNVLKYQLVDVLDRRYNVIENTRNTIANIVSNLNNSISSAIKQLSFGLALERYITSSTNPIGLKALEFTYNDSTTDMTGLDGQTYDNPTFPQIQLTSDELNEMVQQMKQLPSEFRKAMCVLAVPADKLSQMPRDPDEEDALYGYYYAESYTPYPYHKVDYSEVFGEEIDFFYFIYGAIDPFFANIAVIRLKEVEAESLCLGWFYDSGIKDYKVKICVDIKPTLKICDPNNPDNTRTTSAMFVLNVYNRYNFTMKCRIDQYEAPIPAKAHSLILIGAELHGLRGVFVAKSKKYES